MHSSIQPDNLAAIAQLERRLHPAATLRDYYKLFFQSFYGPGHFIEDTDTARRFIEQELRLMKQDYLPLVQDISNGAGYHRVSLSVLTRQLISLEAFAALFVSSVKPIYQSDEWSKQWLAIEVFLCSTYPELAAEKERLFCHKALSGNLLIRHSDNFRLTYTPHYRVMLLKSGNSVALILLKEL